MSSNRTSVSFNAGWQESVWDLGDLVLKTRFARALEEGVSRYPVFRSARFAARTSMDAFFDDIAFNGGFTAERIGSSHMLLEGPGTFVSAHGSRKAEYCSFFFSIWADSAQRAEELCERLLASTGDRRIREPMFSIDWHFLTARGELESASIEELADDVLLDEAYPEIGNVAEFIRRYLDANETVLVLQGMPGTGKTRLIRAILGAISRRKGGEAQALYTGDMKALEGDQIYVKFITGWDDAFVVEDADQLLRPRAEGNEHLHRFLAIADGVIRAQGRKIIFSTNLPNVGDLDEALVRPGRCFAHLRTRQLARSEAEALLRKLATARGVDPVHAITAIAASGHKSHSLAEVYQALERHSA